MTINRKHLGDLPDDGPVALVAEGGRLTRGLNLVGRGQSAMLGPTNLEGNRIIAGGKFDELHLSGLRGDFRSQRSDGIGLSCMAKTVTIQNCRITGITGQHKGHHGDGVQVYVGAKIDVLAITNTTICSAYQGIMSSANINGDGVRTLYLDRVNIRDEPSLRTELSIALYLGDRPGAGVNTAPYKIIFGDVWVDWPDPKKALILPAGAIVSGSIKKGIPPGGDFCP